MRATPKEIERLKDLAVTFTSWLIDTCRAIKNGGVDYRNAALDHARSIIDAAIRIKQEEDSDV